MSDIPQFSRSSSLAGYSSDSNIYCSANLGARRDPVPYRIGDHFDESHSRVIVVALVNPIAEVTEPGGGPAINE